jgi:hypothetical protein
MGENRGLSSAGRPDLVIMDDVIPSDAAYSETVRDHVTDTWFSVIRFIGRADCRFIGVGTVLHKDDLWSKISDERIGGWKHVRLRAYDPDAPEDEVEETVLWKDRWSYEKLMQVYNEEYVADNKEYLWCREMLNDPATSQTNPFIDMVFKHYDVNPADTRLIYGGEMISTNSLYRVMTIDHSQGTGNDDFVIMETGQDHRDIIFMLRVFKSDKANMAERIRMTKKWLLQRKPHKLVIERTTESMSFIDVLESELRSTGLEIRIEKPTPQKFGKKNDRITDRLIPAYAGGRIVHMRGSDVSDFIEDQLRRFDKTRKNNRDDAIDALAWCATFSRRPRPDEIMFEIPNDSLYRIRERIHSTIEEQRMPNHIVEPGWPGIRGAS